MKPKWNAKLLQIQFYVLFVSYYTMINFPYNLVFKNRLKHILLIHGAISMSRYIQKPLT